MACSSQRRRTVGALQLSASYTYSHSIDDASSAGDTSFVNSYDLAASRASSNFDQRHVFTLSYIYDLPFFKSAGLTHTLLGGWQWSGITTVQTGTPFTVNNAGDGAAIPGDNAGVANGIASAGSTPDLVGNPNRERPGPARQTSEGRNSDRSWQSRCLRSTPGIDFRRCGQEHCPKSPAD